jgi:hypothetical protein
MGIPDALVQEVRIRADLVELVAEHTRLKRSGKTFRGPCPLHGRPHHRMRPPVVAVPPCLVHGRSHVKQRAQGRLLLVGEAGLPEIRPPRASRRTWNRDGDPALMPRGAL